MSWLRRPCVVEVAGGGQRAAWYDLQRKRILTCAPKLADQTPCDDAPNAVAREFMDPVPWPIAMSVPRPARNARDGLGMNLISIELGHGASLPQAAGLLREAAEVFGCMHACIIVAAGDANGAVSLASVALEAGMIHVDVLVDRDGSVPVDLGAQIRVVQLDLTVILAARSSSAEAFARLFIVSPQLLLVDPDLFQQLHFFSPDHGVLYARLGNEGVAICTGPFGSAHRIDWVPAKALSAARDCLPIQMLWYTAPDQITNCRHCIFRYACRNSRVFRTVPGDPSAPPSNCLLGAH